MYMVISVLSSIAYGLTSQYDFMPVSLYVFQDCELCVISLHVFRMWGEKFQVIWRIKLCHFIGGVVLVYGLVAGSVTKLTNIWCLLSRRLSYCDGLIYAIFIWTRLVMYALKMWSPVQPRWKINSNATR